jgi:hypothetical protein
MRLIDDSPALFITICFVVLYTVVGVEAGMLAAGGIALMVVTFVGVVLIAAAICAWMFRVLDDGAPVHEPAPAPAPEPTPATAPQAQRAQPAPAGRLVHV